jgi:carbonic anhydrase/acetyltransferase-like protein (isoleucine patch superfamily)
MTTDLKESKKVTIGAGCFIADRCVILPGATLARNATLGSGGLAPKNFAAAPGSVWVGSQGRTAVKLNPGNAASAMTDPTIRPFGKAFYRFEGFKANYFVLSEWFVILMYGARC